MLKNKQGRIKTVGRAELDIELGYAIRMYSYRCLCKIPAISIG